MGGFRLAVCGRFSSGGLRLAVCVWRFIAVGGFAGIARFAGGLRAFHARRAFCGHFAFGGLRAVCGRLLGPFAGALGRFARRTWRFERFGVCSGWRFAGRIFGGLRAVCGRFRLAVRAVCVWRFAFAGFFGGLRLAVCVWRFAGVSASLALCSFRGDLWRFAGDLRAVCGRPAFGGLRAACVWRFEGGLRLGV